MAHLFYIIVFIMLKNVGHCGYIAAISCEKWVKSDIFLTLWSSSSTHHAEALRAAEEKGSNVRARPLCPCALLLVQLGLSLRSVARARHLQDWSECGTQFRELLRQNKKISQNLLTCMLLTWRHNDTMLLFWYSFETLKYHNIQHGCINQKWQ